MDDNLNIKLENFVGALSRLPNKQDIDKTPDGKAETLPIDFIETQLDELFFGMWQTHSFTWNREFNEVVGSIVLEVKHPITGEWLKRTGAGAVIIMQDKDATLDSFNSTKKKNALDLTFPKLKAECLKNAALSIGNVFGRNLNRKKKDVYTPIVKNSIEKRVVKMIENAKSISDLTSLRTDLTEKNILSKFETQIKQKEENIYGNTIS